MKELTNEDFEELESRLKETHYNRKVEGARVCFRNSLLSLSAAVFWFIWHLVIDPNQFGQITQWVHGHVGWIITTFTAFALVDMGLAWFHWNNRHPDDSKIVLRATRILENSNGENQ